MSFTSPILMLAWDKDGEFLAILQDGNGVVPLELVYEACCAVETNLRDPTFLAWSKDGPQLAIGTAKGNLLIYNKIKKQKISQGKAFQENYSGSWSKGEISWCWVRRIRR